MKWQGHAAKDVAEQVANVGGVAGEGGRLIDS